MGCGRRPDGNGLPGTEEDREADTFSKFEVTNGTATTYVDTTDIEPGTKYIYRVHAVNAAGLSEVSRVTATPAATPSIPVTDVAGTSPPSPQGLTASSTHESVTLMWDAGDDPPTGYLILRRVAKQDTFVKFEVTNGTATSTLRILSGVNERGCN